MAFLIAYAVWSTAFQLHCNWDTYLDVCCLCLFVCMCHRRCWCFTVYLDLGAVGFIYANCVNMGMWAVVQLWLIPALHWSLLVSNFRVRVYVGLRIVHHIFYISNFFGAQQKEASAPGRLFHNPVVAGRPSVVVLLSFVAAWCVTQYSEGLFSNSQSMSGLFKHVSVGCICLVIQGIIVFLFDRSILIRTKALLVEGRSFHNSNKDQ